MAGKKPRPSYHCGMCGQQFNNKSDLNLHIQTHADNAPAKLHCQVCKWEFNDSLSLETHQLTNGHGTAQYSCETCDKHFVTSQALKEHAKSPNECSTNLAKEVAPQASAPSINKPFSCDRCTNAFESRQDYDNHRSFKNNSPCADHNYKTLPVNLKEMPDDSAGAVFTCTPLPEEEVANVSGSETPTNLSDGVTWCRKCKNRFLSMSQYNAHALWCATKHGSAGIAQEISEVSMPSPAPLQKKRRSKPKKKKAKSDQDSPQEQSTSSSVPNGSTHNAAVPALPVLSAPSAILNGLTHNAAAQSLLVPSAPPTAPTPQTAPPVTVSAPLPFPCNMNGCTKSYRSEAGLKVHKADIHGVGGYMVDSFNKDSRVFGLRTRDLFHAVGLLTRTPSGSPRSLPQGSRFQVVRPLPLASRSSVLPSRPPAPPMSRAPQRFVPAPVPAFGTALQAPLPVHHARQQLSVRNSPAQAPTPVPDGLKDGGAYEMDQAKFIQGKILRLLIQSDIFINHGGDITVCGIEWTRISMNKQRDVSGIFDGMCHLPKMLQGEYLPPPKAMLSEYKLQYPSSDFQSSPPPDDEKPGLSVIALACSKVVLADGLQDVVKIAAVDLVTCQILMNHLVCTDPTAEVQDWRSNETGLSSWGDMEHARKLGYKVFKGWSCVRSALYKYIDKKTIIVGHNLRADLDTLRMVHGRAVDIAKVAEKAAKGPLSKVQLSLDSLCREFPGKTLRSDTQYGRDMLMNAFAAREVGLWVIKNKEDFEKKMRQKSLEYQALMPRISAS
jgi:hypothetical protein